MPKRGNYGGRGIEWPVRKADAVGRKVRTRREMRNHDVSIPAGSVLEVTRYFTTEADLIAPACACCGVRVFIRKVDIIALELLPVEGSEEK